MATAAEETVVDVPLPESDPDPVPSGGSVVGGAVVVICVQMPAAQADMESTVAPVSMSSRPAEAGTEQAPAPLFSTTRPVAAARSNMQISVSAALPVIVSVPTVET